MKAFITAILLGFLSQVSGAAPCPANIESNPNFLKGRDFLASIQGSYRLGRCLVEIRVCDKAVAPGKSSILAEIFVRDEQNRQQYAPLYFQENNIKKSKTQVKTYDSALYFIFRDHFNDDLNGRTEAVYLDVHKDKKTGLLKRIDLGIYGTKRRVRHGASLITSQWSTCRP